MKKTQKSTASSNSMIYKVLGIGVLLFIAWSYFTKGAPNFLPSQVPQVNEKSAQLTGEQGSKDWGTAAKSTSGVTFELNVTAFLPKPAKGLNYYVYLKGDGGSLKDMLVGKMELSGDVYSLNYQSTMDYFGYKQIVVVKQTDAQSKESKMTPVVLSGTFSQ